MGNEFDFILYLNKTNRCVASKFVICNSCDKWNSCEIVLDFGITHTNHIPIYLLIHTHTFHCILYTLHNVYTFSRYNT